MNTDTYKQKLETEKANLLGELSKLGKNIDPDRGEWEAVPQINDEIESDENDLADRFENYEKDSEEVRVFSARLKEINEALSKLHNGTFGICKICGKKIEDERLDANPAATTCKEHLNA